MKNIASATCLIALGATAQAQAVSLDTLLAGGTVTSGELTFSNFDFIPVFDAPPPFLIDVSSGSDGINFTTSIESNGGDIVDFAIVYTVTAPTAFRRASLDFTGTTTGDGDLEVIETVEDTDGDLLANFSGFIEPGAAVTFAQADVSGDFTTLVVTTDIAVLGSDTGGSAIFNGLNQTFEFGPEATVPSPSAGAVASLAIAGLLTRRRRRA